MKFYAAIVLIVGALEAALIVVGWSLTAGHGHAPRCTAAISATDPVTIVNGNEIVGQFDKPHIVLLPAGCVLGKATR